MILRVVLFPYHLSAFYDIYAMCHLGIMQHGFLYIETQNQWYMTDRGISYTNGLQKSGTDIESI